MNKTKHIMAFTRGLMMILFASIPVLLIALILAVIGIRMGPYELSINPSVLGISYALLIIYLVGRVSSWINNNIRYKGE